MSDQPRATVAEQDLAGATAFNQHYTYSFINNSKFYSFTSHTPYAMYYQRFVRQYFYWYDGYVPWFHSTENGIFSTKVGSSIIKGLARTISGGNLLFNFAKSNKKNNDTAKEFIEDWSTDNNFSNKIKMAIEWSLVGGDSLVKLNCGSENNLWISTHRKDSYLIDTSFNGDITDCQILMYTYTKTTLIDKNTVAKDFYLLENRFYKDGIPYCRYFIKKGMGSVVNGRNSDFNTTEHVKYVDLPRDIKRKINLDFKEIMLDTDIPINFDNLGIYLLKATESIGNIPGLPFGESLFANILSFLLSYDYYFSLMNGDMYIGKGRVLLPKPMENPNEKGNGGANSGFDGQIFQKIEHLGEDGKPVVIQFDLRSNDWTSIRNNLLESISTNLNISVRTIANYLNNSTNTTSSEIHNEEDNTALFAEDKRSQFAIPINQLIKTILKFNGFDDKIVIRFSKIGIVNMNNVITQTNILYAGGLIDLKTGLENVFVDKNDSQIKIIQDNIEKEQKEKMEKEGGQVDLDVKKKVKEIDNNDINHSTKNK